MDAESTSVSVGQLCPSCKGLFEAGAQFCPKDGARLQPAGQEAGLVGQVIDDRYRIVRKIGQGGMGDVYEAAHVYISKRFALKLLRPEVTGSLESVARFHQEARSASSIGHENIVGIDDFGRLPDGSVYLAMELLEGQSLGQRLKQPPPPAVDETIACALQICEGLAAAHDKGVIHRDMKPDNVFLAEKGGVVIAKILDFGIAKMAGDGSAGGTLTRTGAVFGTPHYMSPEQALGKTLDVRSDLYSVGVMLYEMVTGLLPFDAESFMGILTQHITAKLVPPTQVAPDRLIPATLEALIIKALAKEPEDRFSSMGELKAALLEVAAVESPSLHEAWQRRDSGEGRIPSARMLSSKSGDSARPASGEVAAASPALGLGDRGEAARSPATAPAREASRGEAKPPAAAPSVPEAGKPEAIAAPRGEVTLPDDLTPAGSERYRVVAVIAVLAVAIGGLALALSLRARPPAVPASVSGAAVGSAPAPAANTIGVIVDSEPAGAKILIGGRAVGETPEVVPVPLGGKVEITLRREGHEDKVLLLDSSRAKVSVRLERRDRRRPAGASPERPTTKPIAAPRAPSPPPPGLAAPTQRPSTIAVPPPARPPVSPIEPSPRRRPGTATSAPEVLDPYQ